MQSNKGRFKCPHEAQAVWNLYVLEQGQKYAVRSISSCIINISELATHLHKARLINGTIYDEDGRIEYKDVAHTVVQRAIEISSQYLVPSLSPSVDFVADEMLKAGKIRGTIFY